MRSTIPKRLNFSRALDEAWKDVQAVLIVKPLAPDVLRTRLANRIISAANDGERDPTRLKLIALGVRKHGF